MTNHGNKKIDFMLGVPFNSPEHPLNAGYTNYIKQKMKERKKEAMKSERQCN